MTNHTTMKAAIHLASAFLLVPGVFSIFHEPQAQDTPLDFMCAAFPPGLAESDLITRYGAANVTTGPVVGSDDAATEGTILFAGRPDSRVDIVWLDRELKQRPAWIRVRAEKSRWQTSRGITIGLTLKALELTNTRAFRLAGFQTALQGAIISWDGGRLDAPVTNGCAVTVNLQPKYDGGEALALFRRVRSGREYSSAHPAMQALNPRVVSLMISYPGRIQFSNFPRVRSADIKAEPAFMQ